MTCRRSGSQPAWSTPVSDIIVTPSDSHKELVTKSLPKALRVLSETMDLDPYDVDEKGNKTFNGRINGQRLRAALGVVQIVERLGDQALRRQAGTQIKNLIAAIKAEKSKKP